MFDDIKDFVGWWMLVVVLAIAIIQVPGCVAKQDAKNLEYTRIMTKHCESLGKTYMSYPNNSDDGICI